jgi:hypothetical protein
MGKMKGGNSRRNLATHLEMLVGIRDVDDLRFLQISKVSKLANF